MSDPTDQYWRLVTKAIRERLPYPSLPNIGVDAAWEATWRQTAGKRPSETTARELFDAGVKAGGGGISASAERARILAKLEKLKPARLWFDEQVGAERMLERVLAAVREDE